MKDTMKRVITRKRLLIFMFTLLLLVPLAIVSYTFYTNLSQGVQNEELEDEYAERVRELQLEVSKGDPFNLRGNATNKTRVELVVSYDKNKLSRTSLVKNMHLMTHQKISARSKWGAIPMTEENITASSEYLTLLKTHNKVGPNVYDELRTMLENWENDDFSKADQEQDRLLRLLNANRGFSNGLATAAEEELYILNNFGPDYLHTLTAISTPTQ
ncbi:DUF6241 domain-containing protein [Exiguobacterium aurantiacum]|uniref:Uncharacterized protein n=1 Tax=Exiguobacterium aurantiacum TaxID=33987 RepID=A0A377FX07_9BACL|nr:DUF6241 domain-containing protein [Exiguobacterium aurantiacum]STO08965.1 Uncharacterised protein [Exiguobacterium aurantiacum]